MVTQNRRGFTLVELLVVITIIGMLIAMLVPAVQGAREAARQAKCINNQKNLALAAIQYEIAKKRFPGYIGQIAGSPRCWVVPLLPHLGRNDIWESYRDTTTPAPKYMELMVCPSNMPEQAGFTTLGYAVNCGKPDDSTASPPDFDYNGVFHNRALPQSQRIDVTTTDIRDGTAATLMISEHLPNAEWATALREDVVGFTWQVATDAAQLDSWQINTPANPGGTPRSNHPGGVIVAFCDGHTLFLKDNIHYRVYQHLMTPDSKRARTASGGDAANLAGVLNEGDYK